MSLFEVRGLTASYGNIQVLSGIDLTLEAGEVVSVLGPNGVGKTTMLRRIAGLHTTGSGAVIVDGHDTVGCKPHTMLRLGVTVVPEGRSIFRTLSVEDNLRLAERATKSAGRTPIPPARMLEEFPRLAERRKQAAGSLSGGEQQMLSIAKALVHAPRVLALDEPSLGLAQKLVAQVLKRVQQTSADGVAVLLVEQNARMALRYSDRAYVIERGRVAYHGASSELARDPRMENTYLGRPIQ